MMESASPCPFSGFEPTLSQVVKLVLAFTALAVLLLLMLHLFHDYTMFIRLGPGGTPTTIQGYMRVKTLSLFALRDPYKPPPIPAHLPPKGYLGSLPQRKRPRPETRGIAPHRQITQKAPPALFASLTAGISALATTHSSTLVCRTSCFEKHASGLFARDPVKRTCAGEVCHAHPSDGSMHLTLHPGDAKTVLEAGWGERHPLARGGWWERFVPGGFVMVYAPGDEGEVEVVLRIVRGAAWFVGGCEGDREECQDLELDGIGGIVSEDIGEDRRDSGYVSGELYEK